MGGYTAEIYEVWESADEVDLNNIPEPCAVKSNCCSDGVNILLVTDKSQIDLEKAEKDIKENWFDRLKLHTNFFAGYYYGVKPKAYVEEYLKESDDYDVLRFHGRAEIYICQDRAF